jgi:hypothetical protein
MMSVGNDELGAELNGKYENCVRCGKTHDVIEGDPPGMIQAVRCGNALYLVGIKGRRLPDPEAK